MSDWDEMRRQSLDGVIRDVVGEEAPRVKTGDVAREVVDVLFDAWNEGQEWAEAVIRERCREGVRRRVHTLIKASRGVVRISRDGQVIDMPLYVGTEHRNGARSFQLSLWYDLEWPVFVSMISERARQRRILSRELKAFAEVLTLRDRFPGSKTPAEACQMAGIDPRSFDAKGEQTG